MSNFIVHFVYKLFDDKSDPRIQSWITARTPIPTMLMCSLYVYVVKYLGPNLMKNRKPLDMRWLMIFYNFAMVIFNILLFYGFGVYGWFGKYSYKCQPVDYSSSPEALGMLNVTWWYYLSKMVDFTDTIIFIMRKKYNQVTTLHVVHHGIMPMSTWFGLKFTPGGHSTLFAFLNCFVHILMYSYYGLAAIGPHMNKHLWWKKYMTKIQLVQFILIFAHAFQLLFRECDYPKSFVWWIGLHAVLFWYLFIDFYKNTYHTPKAIKNLNGKTAESNGKSLKMVESNGKSLKMTESNGKSLKMVESNGKSLKMNETNGKSLKMVESNGKSLKTRYSATNGHKISIPDTNGCTNQDGYFNNNTPSIKSKELKQDNLAESSVEKKTK